MMRILTPRERLDAILRTFSLADLKCIGELARMGSVVGAGGAEPLVDAVVAEVKRRIEELAVLAR